MDNDQYNDPLFLSLFAFEMISFNLGMKEKNTKN